MPHRASSRLRDIEHRGCDRYFLTYCTFERARVFTTREAVALVNAQFLRAAIEQRFDIPAYCFMPDRVHLLIEGREPAADAMAFIAKSRQYSACRFRMRTGHRLWQRGPIHHVLRDRRRAAAAARYILVQPVRAGLVARPCGYPFSGSFAWLRE